ARDRGDSDGPWIGLGDLRRGEPERGPRGALAHDRPRGPAGTAARRPSHRGGDRPRRIAGTRLTRATADLSLNGKSEEGGNPAQRLELLACFVMAAPQGDCPPRRLR